jgi:FSR family fosmidomycin resistance protein-like MFS transporter
MTMSTEAPMHHRAIGLLSAGHLITDMTQGALPALLPLLVDVRHLTLARAGGLMFALSVTSSIVQPLFGHFADRIAKPWLMPAGLLLTGLGMSLAGVAPTYWLIALVVAVCGLGVAAFHPEAARLANSAAGSRKATGMSIFSVGGNAGFALGPLLAAGVLHISGLSGTVLFALPCFLMAALLFLQLGHFAVPVPTTVPVGDPRPPVGEEAWGPFVWLSVGVICRSVVFYGLITFLPLYFIRILHRTGLASLSLTVVFAVGALGTLLGGRLADRYGYRAIMCVGFALAIPLFLLFMHATNAHLALALLAPFALVFYAPFSAMVVLGQQYLPNRVGLSSGVTLGLSVSAGGVMAPLLGKLADAHGIPATFVCVAALTVLALLVVSTLPIPRPQAALVEEPAVR